MTSATDFVKNSPACPGGNSVLAGLMSVSQTTVNVEKMVVLAQARAVCTWLPAMGCSTPDWYHASQLSGSHHNTVSQLSPYAHRLQ